ncbi:MAG: hypothetical protein H6719_10135 [Sandaracinaceae bacterium]|nr:hypothetical protein [Sandaracinaceae bacterium]
MSWFVLLRWIHILAATAWFGEVVTINLVLVPAVSRMTASERALTLGRIFPRIFRLASILSGTAAVTGLTMFAIKFWGNWLLLFGTWSGRAILAGATLGAALTLFHFFLEPRLGEMICVAEKEPDGELITKIVRLLRIIPRAGLGVIGAIVLLMMIGARGLPL